MRATKVLKGSSLKTVEVSEVTDETDAQILEVAMAAAGETPHRLTDMRVARYTLTPDRVNVFLHTN